MKEDVVHQFLVTDNITFHFNPPSAPHFGGIWEATVKSFKFHLNRVVVVTSLTFEELYTLSSQIEACLNSSPLCVLSSSPDDPSVLTPGHFLIGKALTAIPQPTVPDDLLHCDRWRLLSRMTQHCWNRWSSEYLTLLQSRSKWRIVQKNLDIGDLVLIKHDNSPPTTVEIRENHGNVPWCSKRWRFQSELSNNKSVMEFDCSRIITSTIARLRTEHLKGMKIHPDKTRSYVRCKHCPDLQLTPNHILECPTVATKLLKMGRVPLRDSLREILYSPDAPRIAEAVIKTFDRI
ncbi:integrase catalytic domain-containing protein [Trichonephila clavipes]|nr:integrase catalytic domain-containing protein [Trichonephila clavipes]